MQGSKLVIIQNQSFLGNKRFPKKYFAFHSQLWTKSVDLDEQKQFRINYKLF